MMVGETEREESEKPVRGHHVQNRLGPHGEGLGGGAAGAAPKLGKSSELLMSGAWEEIRGGCKCLPSKDNKASWGNKQSGQLHGHFYSPFLFMKQSITVL